jgi:hypothetical protein
MKDGLYSFRVKGFDGVDWSPGGVMVLRNGVMVGGGPFTYFTGSYSAEHGFFKGTGLPKRSARQGQKLKLRLTFSHVPRKASETR